MSSWASAAKSLVSRHTTVDACSLLPERFEVDISERYALDKLAIGSGTFGRVFIATDKEASIVRKVCVKVLMGIESGQDDQRRDEINILNALAHPNICKVFESFEEGKQIFIVLEYLAGGDLASRIQELGLGSDKLCAGVMDQVNAALRYAHSKNVAHRDIKPDNIAFVSGDPSDIQLKVIDWGVAMFFTGQTLRNVAGTFAFCAPEVLADRKPYDCGCDMWSLGVVLYLCLSGAMPFTGDKSRIANFARGERFSMAGVRWKKVSSPSQDLIKKLLKADPGQRFTAEKVARHPWIARVRKGEQSDPEVQAEVLGNVMSFRDQNILLQLCITAVARQMDTQDLASIYKTFRTLDSNGDGIVSFAELAAGWQSLPDSTGGRSEELESELRKTFKQADFDSSGGLDYTEFCAAGLGKAITAKIDFLWMAFRALDSNGDGKLSKAELTSALGDIGVKQAWSPEVCEEANQNLLGRLKGGDEVEFGEWVQAMQESWIVRHIGLEEGSSERMVRIRSLLHDGVEDKYEALQNLAGSLGAAPAEAQEEASSMVPADLAAEA